MKEQGCAIGKTQKSANYKNFAKLELATLGKISQKMYKAIKLGGPV